MTKTCDTYTPQGPCLRPAVAEWRPTLKGRGRQTIASCVDHLDDYFGRVSNLLAHGTFDLVALEWTGPTFAQIGEQGHATWQQWEAAV
jgi:hypothetical protein